MPRVTIVHVDDSERPFPKWALARKSLGIGSFGMNVVEPAPGESRSSRPRSSRRS